MSKGKRRSRTTIQARRHADLRAPRDGDVRVAASIGPSGEAVTMWSAPEHAPALTARGTARPVRTSIVTHSPDAGARTAAWIPVVFPELQPLPGGRFLVVGARARNGLERNALVYGPDGTVLAEQRFGDGIEHVLCTPKGAVWVGYFDEGVFGDDPRSASGLIRFSRGLQPDWQYPDDSGWDAIADCYALNVDGENAWVCYYSQFPVVRIKDGRVRGWHNDVHGAKALAVGGSRVALFGGYGPDRDRLVVAELGADRLHVTGEYRVAGPDGNPLPESLEVVGRGADLHLLTAGSWWRIAVDDLPAGARH